MAHLNGCVLLEFCGCWRLLLEKVTYELLGEEFEFSRYCEDTTALPKEEPGLRNLIRMLVSMSVRILFRNSYTFLVQFAPNPFAVAFGVSDYIILCTQLLLHLARPSDSSHRNICSILLGLVRSFFLNPFEKSC